ncbi:MAG: hypothetical protein AAGI91_15595 [Bacteroidota bacterium]
MRCTLRLACALLPALALLSAGCDEGPLEDLNAGIPTFVEVVSDTSGFDAAGPGEALPVMLRITDPYGDLVSGAEVVWRPDGAGTTSVEPDDTTRTNADGVTEATWRVGDAGAYSLRVQSATATVELSAEVR